MDQDLHILYQHFLKQRIISTDSRAIQPGCIFFALKGERFDGNDFLEQALDQGASLVVTDRPQQTLKPGFMQVRDVLETLQSLARLHRQKMAATVIAITGSNGKTTTKELVAAILERKYSVVATTGNLNNHIGVPLTLLRLREDTRMAVIEMGANHPGEIGALCRIALPDFGLITNIGKAHLEGFGNYEGVVATKTEMYRFLKDSGGTAFVNHDDPVLKPYINDLLHYTYGNSAGDFIWKPLGQGVTAGLSAQPGGVEIRISSALFGRYNDVNIAAAAAIGVYFSVAPDDIRKAVETYIPKMNRSQILQTPHNLLVLDAYNANPASMEAAIGSFRDSAWPGRCVILGDMLELGQDSDKEHLKVLTTLESAGFEKVFLVGSTFFRLNSHADWIAFGEVSSARRWFEEHPLANQTILIKGSRGIRLENLVSIF